MVWPSCLSGEDNEIVYCHRVDYNRLKQRRNGDIKKGRCHPVDRNRKEHLTPNSYDLAISQSRKGTLNIVHLHIYSRSYLHCTRVPSQMYQTLNLFFLILVLSSSVLLSEACIAAKYCFSKGVVAEDLSTRHIDEQCLNFRLFHLSRRLSLFLALCALLYSSMALGFRHCFL